MTVRADICEDTIDTDYYGWIQGFAYIAGADREGYLTDISIPLLPEDENPRTVPYIHFLGEEGRPIEDFLAVYDQITALLSDPRIQSACRRFERLRAKAA